jgi:hypothetical protein
MKSCANTNISVSTTFAGKAHNANIPSQEQSGLASNDGVSNSQSTKHKMHRKMTLQNATEAKRRSFKLVYQESTPLLQVDTHSTYNN